MPLSLSPVTQTTLSLSEISGGTAENINVLDSATYGVGYGFGNVPSSFTFSGTGTPADIYAPLVMYVKYGDTTNGTNTPITKTTQAWFSAAAYYGPTADDSMECGSCFVAVKDTGTPFTQTKTVTGFEAQAQIEGGNTASGNFIGAAGRLKFLNTSTVSGAAIGVYSTYQKDAGATVSGTYYAFKQATAGPSTTNYGLYAIDRVMSEQGLRVGRSGDNGLFNVDWGFSNGNAFVYAQLPNGTDKQVVRIQAISGQTQHMQGWWDSASNERAFVSVSGFIFTNGTGFTAQLSGVDQMRLSSTGLQWAVSGLEQTTVGSAGSASSLPANPTKYLKVKDSTGTVLVIPAYAAA